jgi:hypothetical protein
MRQLTVAILCSGQRPVKGRKRHENWQGRVKPMMRTERRQTPRMTVKELAYVNLEPNNGGIILNISEGGLGFHSATPIHQAATIRFWFSQRNNRFETNGRLPGTDEAQTRSGSRCIEVESTLAWTDEAQRRGGLRFTNLPSNARKEIRDWISQHAMPVAVDEKSAPSLASSRESPPLNTSRRNKIGAYRSSAMFPVLSPDVHVRRLFAGFSGGLTAGILASALLAAVFLLQNHRRELGESLIRWGERLGGISWPQRASSAPQPSSPKPHTASSEPQPAFSESQLASSVPQRVSPEPHTASAEPQLTSPALIPVPRQEKLLSSLPVAAVNPHGLKLDPAPAAVLPTAKAGASVTAAMSSSTPPRPSVLTISGAPISDPGPDMLRAAVPLLESPNPPSVHIERSKVVGSGSASEKFLEVAKFNDKLWADETTGKLSQFGFPVMVVQKSHFWKKSYQVLVGPYDSDQEAEVVHKNLASRGFAPRSFERGTRGFMLPHALRLGGTNIPVGDYVISWESYVPDAIVKFQSNRGVAVTVEGKWVKRGVKYSENAVVYTNSIDGSHNLIEIRFSGMGQALVFDKGNI